MTSWYPGDLEQRGGQRSHPAALRGREGFLLPGGMTRIAQVPANTRRTGEPRQTLSDRGTSHRMSPRARWADRP